MNPNNGGQFFIGVVEDRADPLMLGRVKCRVVGLHTHDTTALPTNDLPWAMMMQPIGIASPTATGLLEGTTCIVVFNDWPECQQPVVIGTLPGIPQGRPVFVEEFEDTPLFKDDITPQGRPIPRDSAESTGNQTGPLTGPSVNPILVQITQQSQEVTTDTAFGVLQNTLEGTSLTLGGVGGLTGAVNALGSTSGGAKNVLEDLLLTTGNKDAAVEEFKDLAASSGPVGSVIANAIAGNATLKTLATEVLGLDVSKIQAAFVVATDFLPVGTKDTLSVLQAVEQSITSSAVTAVRSFGDLLSSFTVQETNLEGSATAALSTIVPSTTVEPTPTPLAVSSLFSVDKTLSSQQVSQLLNADYSSASFLSQNIGNVSAIISQSSSTLDSTAFEEVGEGNTPPINGVYGGPNFGGGTAELEIPTTDISKYQGGSQAPIATTPPPNWQGDRARAEQGIQALLAACEKYKFTTNEQKASLLAIVGGECGWIPQAENAQYSSPARLCEIFQTTFKGKESLAEKYCAWVSKKKGTREQFFDFVYDPANNGRQLGNTKPGDGGKFYGRGFIQLTGRANYERYAKLSNHPIDTNPDLLITDPAISAEIAVLYLMDRVSKGVAPTAHPGYYYAAVKSVGNNSRDIAAKKLEYYEYFYQTRTPESYGYADKEAGNSQSRFSYNGALQGNDSGFVKQYGFVDPHGKYPLRRYSAEPEINRLARGVIKETIVPLKESQRLKGIPIANNGGYWDQPNVPYGAKYPFNSVTETESGHIEEWDDTPGYERIHRFHRTGTFEEIDANGTKVTRVVGDKYTIVDRNGFISITGNANLTVNGNINILCQSDANIEVSGSAEMKVGGNFNVGVARDMNIAVGGDFSLWASGSMNIQSAGRGHVLAQDNLYISSNKQLHTRADDGMFTESFKGWNVKSLDDANIQAGGSVNVTSGSASNITSGGPTNISASGNVNIDGAVLHLNSGTAAEASESQPSIKALVHGMVPPPIGVPAYINVEPLSPPPLLGEERFMYELPEEGQTAISSGFIADQTSQQGKQNTYEADTSTASGGSDTAVAPTTNINEILNTTEFTADFRLSKHFTLGMMFDGGFNVRHKLVDQNGLTRQQIVANLATLCENILEKYLEKLPDGIAGYGKKWRITSGYRMGTNTSDHSRGRACDIALIGGKERKELHYQLIQELDKLVPYDQLILEYQGDHMTWIHTSFRGDGNVTFGGGSNRKMAFTMRDHKTHGPGFILLG